jgi:uncharacterized protein with PIN domain
MSDQPTIDCQDCGTVLRKLSDEQAQEVARNPYNFIFYCSACRGGRR